MHMPQITVSVLNDTSDNQNVYVYDQFANGRRLVDGSPFALASGGQSDSFVVNADNSGKGDIAYNFNGGPGSNNSNIDVKDGDVVKVS
jgi:hypothetical protein